MDPTPATVPETASTSTLTPTRILFPPPSHHEQAHEDCIYHLALTSKHLITASKDQTVRVWDLETQHLAYAPLQGHTGSALCTAILEAQDFLFTGGVDGRVRIWQLSTGKSITTIPSQPAAGSVLSLAVSSKFLVASYKDKIARVWTLHLPPFSAPDAENGELVRDTAVLDGHGAAVNVALIGSGDDFVVTASGDRTIRVWETGTWSCVRTISGHMKGVACLAWMGEKLVSGSSDDSIRIWDLRTGVEEACLHGHSNLVRSICVAEIEGEEVIVSGGYDERVVVWGRVSELSEGGIDEDGNRTWEVKKIFSPADMLGEEKQEEQTRVFRVACDGKRIYAASQAKVVVAWEIGEPSNAVEKVEMIGRKLW